VLYDVTHFSLSIEDKTVRRSGSHSDRIETSRIQFPNNLNRVVLRTGHEFNVYRRRINDVS
jgi:hypothetical protein